MTRITSSLATAFFQLLAPGTVAGLVPWWMTGWQRIHSMMPDRELVQFVGVASIVLGLIGLLESLARFAFEGRATSISASPTSDGARATRRSPNGSRPSTSVLG